MPSIADVFMRIRVDSSQVKRDAEAGLSRVDTKTAGKKAGQDYGDGLSKGAGDGLARVVKDTDKQFGSAGRSSGSLFGSEFDKQASSRVGLRSAGALNKLGAGGSAAGGKFGSDFDAASAGRVAVKAGGALGRLGDGKASGERFGAAFDKAGAALVGLRSSGVLGKLGDGQKAGDRFGGDFDKASAARVGAGSAGALSKIGDGKKAGGKYGSDFDKASTARVGAGSGRALGKLGNGKKSGDTFGKDFTTAFLSDFQRMNASISKGLTNKNLRVRVNAASLQSELAKVTAEAAKATGDQTIKVNADTIGAAVQLRKLETAKAALGRNVKIKVDVDQSVFARLKGSFTTAGGTAGESFNKGLKEGPGGGAGGAGGGLMNPALIGGIAVVGLAVIPGLMAAAGAAGAVALGAAFAFRGSKALKDQGGFLLKGLDKTFIDAAKPLVKPLHDALGELGRLLPTIGKLFGDTFKAVAPLVSPLLKLFTGLVITMLPGFITLMKAAAGPLASFFVIIGKLLGSSLGKFFADLAPAVGPSLAIFVSLLKVFLPLLPVIAALSRVLVVALEPVFKTIAAAVGQSAGVFTQLLIALLPLAKTFAVLFTAIAPLIPPLLRISLVLLTGLLIPALNKLTPILIRDVIPAFQKLGQWIQKYAVPWLNKIADVLQHNLIPWFNLARQHIVNDFVLPLVNFFTKTLPHAWDVTFAAVKSVFTGVRNFFVTVWNSIRNSTLTIWNAIRGAVVGVWNAVVGAARTVFNALRNFFGGVWSGIRGAAVGAWNAIRGALIGAWNTLRSAAGTVFNALRNFFTGVWNAIRGAAIGAWNAIRGALTAVWNTLRSAAATVFNALRNFFTGLWAGIRGAAVGAWNAIRGALVGVWNALRGAASTVFNAIRNFLGTTWTNISNGVKSAWNAVRNFLTGLWNALSHTAQTVWHAVQNFFGSTWTNISNGVKSAWHAVQNFLTGVWNALSHAAQTVWHAVQSFFGSTWTNISNGVKSAWNAIKGFFVGVWNGLSHTAQTVWKAVQNFFGSTWTNISNGVKSAWNTIKAFFTGVWNGLSHTAQTVWKVVQDFFGHTWTNIKNGVTSAWNTIKGIILGVWNNLKSSATTVWNGIVKIIHDIWGTAVGIVKVPIKAIVTGYNVFAGAVNTIANKVFGQKIDAQIHLPPNFRAGGKITTGTTDTADDVLVRVSRNETILSAAHSRILSPALSQLGVPGYAAGGKLDTSAYRNPLALANYGVSRVDQGVDFTGSGPVTAIGASKMLHVATGNTGWGPPNGPAPGLFMTYRLTNGPLAGAVIYLAEGASPHLKAGDTARAGQLIATMNGSSIETGFANAAGTGALSQTAEAGGISGANLGEGGTQVGQLFEELLMALGVKRAPNEGHPAPGKIPGNLPGNAGWAAIIKALNKAGSFAVHAAIQSVGELLGQKDLLSAVPGPIAAALGLADKGLGGVEKLVGKAGSFVPSMIGGGLSKVGGWAADWLDHKVLAKVASLFHIDLAGSDGGGGINVGPVSGNEKSVIEGLLKALGAPASAANEHSMQSWIAHEFPWPPPARFNPMATTLRMPGSTNYNTVGPVQNYTSWQQGIEANARTIISSGYPTILSDLRSGKGIGANAAHDLSRWSGGGYSSVAAGGLIPGFAPGRDTVPAMLSPGEFVMNPRATRAVGAGNLHAINNSYPVSGAGTPGGFAAGGKVDVFGASNASRLAPFITHPHLNSGIEGALALRDNARFARAISGTDAALLWEGYNDIAAGSSAASVAGANAAKVTAAHKIGVPVVLGSLQPGTITNRSRLGQITAYNKWAAGGADAYAAIGSTIPKGQVHGDSLAYTVIARAVDARFDTVLKTAATAQAKAAKAAAAAKGQTAAAADAARVLALGRGHSRTGLTGLVKHFTTKLNADAARGDAADYSGTAAALADVNLALARYASPAAAEHDAQAGFAKTALANANAAAAKGDKAGFMTWNQKYLAFAAKVKTINQQIAAAADPASAPVNLATLTPIQKLAYAFATGKGGLWALVENQLKNHSLNPAAIGNLSKGDMAGLATNATPTVLGALYAGPGTAGANWKTLADAFTTDLFNGTGISGLGSQPALALLGKATGVHGQVSGKKFAHGGMITEPTYGITASGQRITLGEAGRERVVPGGSDPLLFEVRKLRIAMEEAPARTAAGVAKAVAAPRGAEMQAARLGAKR